MNGGDHLTSAVSVEEERIRNAYARRAERPGKSRFDPAYQFMIEDRERHVLRLLHRHGFANLSDQRILDVGCGTGQWLRDFVRWGAAPGQIMGVDLLSERVDLARRLCPAGVVIEHRSAATLGFPNECFDLVVQSTVFTSILDPGVRRLVAREMVRVLRPDGLILWYDFHVDNPANADVRGVTKVEIHNLFPACRIELRRITLASPIVRAVAPYSRLACEMLASVPLLRTHYLGAIQRQRR